MFLHDFLWFFLEFRFSALCFRRGSEIIQPHPPRGQTTLDMVRARELAGSKRLAGTQKRANHPRYGTRA